MVRGRRERKRTKDTSWGRRVGGLAANDRSKEVKEAFGTEIALRTVEIMNCDRYEPIGECF